MYHILSNHHRRPCGCGAVLSYAHAVLIALMVTGNNAYSKPPLNISHSFHRSNPAFFFSAVLGRTAELYVLCALCLNDTFCFCLALPRERVLYSCGSQNVERVVLGSFRAPGSFEVSQMRAFEEGDLWAGRGVVGLWAGLTLSTTQNHSTTELLIFRSWTSRNADWTSRMHPPLVGKCRAPFFDRVKVLLAAEDCAIVESICMTEGEHPLTCMHVCLLSLPFLAKRKVTTNERPSSRTRILISGIRTLLGNDADRAEDQFRAKAVFLRDGFLIRSV
jgi:hypothetical protein